MYRNQINKDPVRPNRNIPTQEHIVWIYDQNTFQNSAQTKNGYLLTEQSNPTLQSDEIGQYPTFGKQELFLK